MEEDDNYQDDNSQEQEEELESKKIPETSSEEYPSLLDEIPEEPEQTSELDEEETELLQKDDSEEEEEEEAKTKKQKSKTKDKRYLQWVIQQERLAKNQIANEKALLLKQLEEKDSQLRIAADAANYHLEASVDQRINAAQKAIHDAKEVGDIDAEIKATNELQQANIAKSKSEDWRFQQQLQRDTEQSYQEPEYTPLPPNPVEVYREGIEEWDAANRFWSDPRSPQYNPSLVQGMPSFVARYNQDLMQSGYGHMIGGDEYRQVLQNKVNEALSQSSQQSRRQPQMKQLRSGGAPVRAGYQSSRQQKDVFNGDRQTAREAQEMLEGLRGVGFKADPQDFKKHYEDVKRKQRQQMGW